MRFPLRVPALPARRQILAVAALVAHVVAAIGAPVPLLRTSIPGKSSVPYPCGDHPCGCLNAEQCWAGDCCCFTLEQKLAWADARGIAPPEHVRPEVEARKARSVARPKKACCRTERDAPPAGACREQNADPVAELGVRWVAGAFSQKCRGQTPAGLLELDPAVPPTADASRHAKPDPARFDRVPHPLPIFTQQAPPTPPPRLV